MNHEGMKKGTWGYFEEMGTKKRKRFVVPDLHLFNVYEEFA